MILLSLAYLTPIKFPFRMSTDKREGEGGRGEGREGGGREGGGRERIFQKKKKNSKLVRNHFTFK